MITVFKIVVYLIEILKLHCTNMCHFLMQSSSVTLRIMKAFIYTTHRRTGQRGDTHVWSSAQTLHGLQMTYEMTAALQPAVWCCPLEYVTLSNQKEARELVCPQDSYMIATDCCRKSNCGTLDSADISTFVSILSISQNTVLLVLTENQIFSPVLCFTAYTKSSE